MRHNVTLKQLRCFVTLADTGSFTVAASRLFMTQSSLTATIQQFEDAVGVKMFDRTTRRVVLTRHAEAFRAEAQRVVNGFDSAIGDLMALGQGQRGHISIGAAASVIHEFLIPAIPVFRASFPQITIALRDPAAAQVERMVLEGEVDFAIESRHRGFEGLHYTPLVADRYGVVCHRDLPLAQCDRPLRWSDLTPEDYVAFSADTGIGQFLQRHAATWPVLGGTHDEVASTTSLFAVLGMGLQYSVVPAMALRGRHDPDLVFRELHEPALSREICVITRRLRALAPSAQRLLDILLADLRSRPLPPGVTLVAANAP
ncbi:LysR family transcriptional regulator [uncultured Xylophilus sp.]|uniref:LysR family transcriptional regulator n=1 Tax=uncultured Xylophilus sp. TaxID=296832 RepID=UPI0025D4B49A|nr:LysR family transcriptional regulator [uncultured Xylophilus sp.]